MNILCSEKVYLVFNKKCTKKEYEAAQNIMTKIAHHFYLTRWVYSREMTEEEKAQYPSHNVCDGYLKKYEYKEAFKNALDKCSLEIIKEIKTIKNFNDKKFKEISGCDLNEIIKSKENKNANK
jgi:hypothetical protein